MKHQSYLKLIVLIVMNVCIMNTELCQPHQPAQMLINCKQKVTVSLSLATFGIMLVQNRGCHY